jgi:hypothetical protein
VWLTTLPFHDQPLVAYGKMQRAFAQSCILLLCIKIFSIILDFIWPLACLLTLLPNLGFARDLLSDDEIAIAIVRESRQEYYSTGHPCACPDDHMRNGRVCGNVSAYIRPGGAQPLCYVRDVTPTMILHYRAQHGSGNE